MRTGLGLALCLLAGGVAQAADELPSANVPLKKVVLFNSGVGFFEHAAELDGNARVELKFNVDDVNDLLKSMVLQDLGGGRVSTVNYGSKDPITKTLKTFAIDLTTNPTLADLLSQIRGEKVQVEAPNQLTGVILGVEKRRKASGDSEPVEVAYLNLLTDEGLRSIALESVGRIKLMNERLDAELRQALMILALGHASDKKTVTLNFLGQGKRPVRVGYVQEAPIWKTSYRLVLKDDGAPFLQGWAIVENTTEEDWKDVGLTLVSGRPISFIMDLYQPLYVQRPTVEPELFASLRPQTYGQDMTRKNAEFAEKALPEIRAGLAGAVGGASGARPAAPAPMAAESMRRQLGRGLADGKDAEVAAYAFNPAQGVKSAASAGDVGELFQYVIETPVTLPRQQSAMLPIVNGSVEAKKVSIYNPAVQVKHPLNGLQLTNSTGLHLMQGPITVFDDGAYAGDAQIQDLQPGTQRLVSYAMDLDVEVAPEVRNNPDQLVSCKLVKGLLISTHKYERTSKYVVKNSGKKAKTVLVERPVEASWSLVSPTKADEKTRDTYRFAVDAQPGKPATLAVEEERISSQQVALNNLDDNTIRFYQNSRVVSDGVKAALQEVVKRKAALAEVRVRKQQLEQQVKVIDEEQARIRQNMAQLDRNTDLYNRYVKKFGEQEDKVDGLRNDIRLATEEEAKLRKSLDDYLLAMNVE